MTTPLFLLRCKQLGLSMPELDLLTIGLINDMFTERENIQGGMNLLLKVIWICFDYKSFSCILF